MARLLLSPRFKFLFSMLAGALLTVGVCFAVMYNFFADRGITLACLMITNYTYLAICISYYMGYQRLVNFNNAMREKIKKIGAFTIHVPGKEGREIEEALKKREQELAKQAEERVQKEENVLREKMRNKVTDEYDLKLMTEKDKALMSKAGVNLLMQAMNQQTLKQTYLNGVHEGELNCYMDLYDTMSSCMNGYGVTPANFFDMDGEMAKKILYLVCQMCSGRQNDNQRKLPNDLDDLLDEIKMDKTVYQQGWIDRELSRASAVQI